MEYHWQKETIEIFNRVYPIGAKKTMSHAGHQSGVAQCEPIYIILDSLIRYVKAAQLTMDHHIVDEITMAPYVKDILSSMLQLGNYNGAVAMGSGNNWDSKDNTVLNAMVDWICEFTGIDRDSL